MNDSHLRDKRTDEARKRLGVTAEQMACQPVIGTFFRHMSGGTPGVVAALRLVDDDVARQFLAKYDAIPQSDRVRLTVEEIGVAANVDLRQLLGVALLAVTSSSKNEGAFIAASKYPEVITAMAESACVPGLYGDKARDLFSRGTGFLPDQPNRGGGVFAPTYNVTNIQNNRQLVGDTEEAVSVSAEDELQRLHSALDSRKLLQAPAQPLTIPRGVVMDAEPDQIPAHVDYDKVQVPVQELERGLHEDEEGYDCIPSGETNHAG